MSVTPLLRHTATTIERSTAGTGSDGDLVLSALTTIASNQACALLAVKAGSDMTLAGPLPDDTRLLLMGPTANLKQHDEVTVGGVIWSVRDPPQVFTLRGADHHTEAVVVRKAVQ